MHPELREEPDGRRVLASPVHSRAVRVVAEVGRDISDQRPKRLGVYLGREFFNYLVIVCARAEERCSKTCTGVGVRFSWIFDDPRSGEGLPYDSMLERYRQVRDDKRIRVKDWRENPEAERGRLRGRRERDRPERVAGGRSSPHSG